MASRPYGIFVRETAGTLDANANLTPLTGTLLKGTRHTVVRVDATVTVEAGAVGPPSIFFEATLNDQVAGYSGHGGVRRHAPLLHAEHDALVRHRPARGHPSGDVRRQPLNVVLPGGGLTGGSGRTYWATFDAHVVKALEPVEPSATSRGSILPLAATVRHPTSSSCFADGVGGRQARHSHLTRFRPRTAQGARSPLSWFTNETTLFPMLETSPVVRQSLPGASSFVHELLNLMPAVARQLPSTPTPLVTAFA